MSHKYIQQYNFLRNISTVESQAEEENTKPSLQNQIISCIICNLGAFSFGVSVGWNSPALLDLKNKDILTDNEATWVGSLLPLGAFISLPLFTYYTRIKGCKNAAYLIGIMQAIGFGLKSWADSAGWILTGRFVCGFGGGGAFAIPPLYIGETCEPRAQGILSSIMMIEYAVGLLSVLALGEPLESADLLSLVFLPVPIIFILGFWFIPETPIYQLKLGQEEKAIHALAWLRKLPLDCKEVKDELECMAKRLGLQLPLPPLTTKLNKYNKKGFQSRKKPGLVNTYKADVNKIQKRRPGKIHSNVNNLSYIQAVIQLLKSKSGIKGFSICLFLITLQTFTGSLAVSSYITFIFQIAGSPLSPYICSIIFTIIVLAGILFGSIVIDKAGRRVLQIRSCIIMAISETVLGLSIQFINNHSEINWLKWIPLISLTIYTFTYNMGAGNIPFVIMSEIFISEVQEVATHILMMYIWITSFVLLQFFPGAVEMFGLHNVFYGFACVSLISSIFSHFFLIETKGKSLEEIQIELIGKKELKLCEHEIQQIL